MPEKENGTMLKKADLQAIKDIFRDEIEANNKRLENHISKNIDKTIEDNNKKISRHFDKAIEDNNKLISDHFDKAIEDNNKLISDHFDKTIEDNNKKIFDMMESNTELILNAVEDRIKETESNIQNRLERLETVYRIRNLEDSNQSDMMKMIFRLDKRVTELETNKTA